MKEEFNIDYWLSQSQEPHNPEPKPQQSVQAHTGTQMDDFIHVRDQIVSRGLDITNGYFTWRDLGFAIAYDLGEAGRQIYHDISRFNPEYNYKEADQQYTACLNGKGNKKITGRTFFEMAKRAGLDIHSATPKFRNSAKSAGAESTESAETPSFDADSMPAPSFSEEIRNKLPEFMQKVISRSDNEKEADILILGTLSVVSACLPNYMAVYDDVTLYPNLCTLVTARAASGKGRVGHCRELVQPIHDELQKEFKAMYASYEAKMVEYDRAKRDKKAAVPDKPEKPPLLMLVLQGDTSSTAVKQIMHDNGGTALLVEPEADTLVQSFKSDFGDYSVTFRNAFLHEPVGYHRRGGDEHIEVDKPKLSAVVSGTPEQIKKLIRSPENGLFSRFAYYFLESPLEFRNVFKRKGSSSLDKHLSELGEEYLDFYHAMKEAHEREFSLTKEQEDKFYDYFSEKSIDQFIDFGEGIVATMFRLAVITFRIAMILTALRMMETGDLLTNPVCSDTDFNTALIIGDALRQHASKVFCELFGAKSRMRLSASIEQSFLDALPEDFGRKDYIQAAKALEINPRTAEGYISKFCLKNGPVERIAYGKYHKKS